MISELNVLIVEDDEFQCRIISSILASLGIERISQAGNGRQALEIIHDSPERIDIALCDLNMPEMDGMEFLRHLGEEHQSISVILTSAMDGKLLTSVGRMTRLYGIDLLGIMEKPVLLENLRQLLSKYGKNISRSRDQAARILTLEEILKGIEDDQFEPYFQPKVDLKTGRLLGAEALARWIHPVHGVIGPIEFIPHLERTGNIDDLTFRILEKSAKECLSFHENGRFLTISVNLSLVSLDDIRLADKITRIVRMAGIDPQYIVLEITESAAMTNVAPALENLARLCINGFSLSIDDYGTGTSNMEQLTRIAFSELKIDQSFVRDFSENRSLRIVVRSSIDMAHKLNVKSVAEGVETRQNWDALKAAGCDTAQGYLIAKPMDAKSFAEFIDRFDPESLSPSTVPLPAKGQTKILVVDDDGFARGIILRVLGGLGFSKITDAHSAESAIKLFESDAFDLVITDINMPEMNGLKFIQMIRSAKTHARPDSRIIVLTLFSQTEILGAALALDVNGFLIKPVVPAAMEEKLERAMTEQFHLRSPIAYEMVKTEPRSLDAQSPAMPGGAAIVLKENSGRQGKHSLSLNRLRPGMVLAENVRLKDGTLILASGHALSELSINRLKDIEALLPASGIFIEVAA